MTSGLPPQRRGYYCRQPVKFEFQSEAYMRPCGRCRDCFAISKRDIAARAAAEAYSASEVVVFTLTYRDGEAGALDFETPDRQKFLKRVRDLLHRKARREVGAPKRLPRGASDHVRAYWKQRIDAAKPFVRLLGCGERGERSTRRCHWHIVLFLSKPSGFVSTPPDKKGKPGRENIEIWPHGFVNVHVLPHGVGDRMRAVRYAVKYVDKARRPTDRHRRAGVQPAARFFRSLASPLGFAYLTSIAIQTAQACLPLSGEYRVPGLYFSHGGQLVRCVIRGRMRDHYIAAYRREWERCGWSKDVPMNDFMLRYDDDACSNHVPEVRDKPKSGYKKLAPWDNLKNEKRDRQGYLAVSRSGTGFLGMVHMRKSGYATFEDKDGTSWPLEQGTLRGVVVLDDGAHERVEAWITDRRGPGWRSARTLRRLRYERAIAQRDVILRVLKPSPRLEPDWVPGLPPLTAYRRRCMMLGSEAHIPGTVVMDIGATMDKEGKFPAYVRPVMRLRSPVDKRLP